MCHLVQVSCRGEQLPALLYSDRLQILQIYCAIKLKTRKINLAMNLRLQVNCGLTRLPLALLLCSQLRLLDLALNPALLADGGAALHDGRLEHLICCRELDLSQRDGVRRQSLR